MGITDLSLARINRYIHQDDSLLLIGCQNLYNSENYGQIAQEYFSERGHNVVSLDILGCQGSLKLDLRNLLDLRGFDIVNDCGSKEHVDGSLYIPFKNVHNACRIDGAMIHENPRTGHWPQHCQHYFSMGFYTALAEACGYEILELCEEPAMGNSETGMNVCCVLRMSAHPFVSKKHFNEIYAEHIKQS